MDSSGTPSSRTERIPAVRGNRSKGAESGKRRRLEAGFRPVATLGGLALVVSAFMPLTQVRFQLPLAGVPFRYLWNGGNPNLKLTAWSLGLALALAGAVGILASFLNVLSAFRRVVAVLAVVAFAMLVYQLVRDASIGHVASHLGLGPYMALGGGLLLLLG